MSGSLSAVSGFVNNAFAQIVQNLYRPEDIRLGVYTFLPWARTGLASIVQNPAPGQIRATVTVSVDVQDDKGGSTPVQKTLTLRGPGDVLGLQTSQIVRCYPAPNTPDAQDPFLAYVEFDRPELPWLFTPFAPSGANQEQLPPWLALVVLEAKRASFEAPPPGVPQRPARVRTRKGELQPLTHSWAFAHVQVPGDTGGSPQGVSVRADGAPGVGPDTSSPRVRDRLTDGYGPVNLSRLLCPRRLDDGKSYVACIVPAFDCGVKVAMGLPGGTLEPAWTRAAGDDDEEIVLPVYYQWRFSTAKGGDFEELARRLVPVKAPWKVGRRFIDAHLPRGGLSELAPDAPGRLQVLKCALFSASAPPAGSPAEDAAWSTESRTELQVELDRGDAVALSSAVEDVDLPRVGARLYARFHRGEGRIGTIDDNDWFDQLNTRPAHRIVAGLGTRVVQKDQEQLMQSAWAQVGAIDAANRALVRAQYARFLGASLHKRFLSRLELSSLTQVTRTVQGKIRMNGSALTIRGDIEKSSVAPAAADWTFRRAVRPRGAVVRFADAAAGAILDRMVAPDGAFKDFQRDYLDPDGVAGLRPETVAALDPAVVAEGLGVSAAEAIGRLQDRLKSWTTEPATADRLHEPVQNWGLQPGRVDAGRLAATRVLAVLAAATPEDAARDPARAEAVGGLLQGIATSGIEGVDGDARKLVDRIVARLPSPTTRPGEPDTPTGRLAGRATPVTGRVVAGPTVLSRTSGRIVRPTGPTVAARDATVAARSPLADRTRLLESPTTVALGMKLRAAAVTTTANLANDLSTMVRDVGLATLPSAPERKPPSLSKATLLAELEPAVTVTRYAKGRLKAFPSWLAADWFLDGLVQPIMAAPEFKRPMYEALDAYDRDWLVPGLGLIKRTDFVTLLSTNAAFTEAFLVGLSDEMGRELLWREYPTDQRGTYFKYFWDDDQDELVSPIHRFSRKPLGQHIAGGGEGRVVFVVRGALVKRYPDAYMFAIRQIPPFTGEDAPVFADPSQEGASAAPIFHANLPPDILLVGFDLKVQQVIDEKWWFFIAEHPTAPRFGLDVEGTRAPAGSTVKRNDLDWNDVSRTNGGRFILPAGPGLTIEERTADPPPQQVSWPPASSAVLARVFLQNPIRAAYEGAKLLDDIQRGRT
jgi:hypothetical protein